MQAETCLPPHLPKHQPRGRNVVLALGKAAGYMARVALDQQHVDQALIVTRHGHMPSDWTPPAFAQLIEAGHPNPDAASLKAGRAAIAMAQSLIEGDRLIALVSGGGSALMAAPVEGISFRQKQAINRALLASGAPIAEMNRVRAALSRIKGGRLAALAHPAEVLTYVISDVPGDDPAFVASGPTCPLPHGEDVLAILSRYGISVGSDLAQIVNHARSAPFIKKQVVVCAKASDALQAISSVAKAAGYQPLILGDDLEGDAGQLAHAHARLALEHHRMHRRTALISGGETSVAVSRSGGHGGRNLTYALTLALQLNGTSGIGALAADSDGIDGTSAAAGAIILPSTLACSANAGIDAKRSLQEQTSSIFFEKLGDSILTRPTGTNVNDLRIILVNPEGQ